MSDLYNNDDDDIESDRDDDVSDRYDANASDEEFIEIRRKSRAEKKQLEEYYHQYDNEGEIDKCDGDVNSGGSMNGYTSEESDEEYCYAEPASGKRSLRIEEVFNVNTPGKDIKWKVGLIFASKKEFKNVVRVNSMSTGRPFSYLVDDLVRMQVVCAKGCPFKTWVNYIKDREAWQIKTVINDHNYVWNYKNRLVTMKFLTERFGDRIRKNPNWKLTDMQEEIKRVLKVDVCEAKCCRVRQRALRGVEDKKVEHYANLRKFGGEVLRSNRENTIKISTTRLKEGDALRFQRMYVSYGSLKKSWREACRPVLGLDGCFLKTVCGRQLLSAVGRYGNNCIFPVAMAVVESENYDSWKWFLQLLIDDLDLQEGYGKTLISDQQKGLDKAIKEMLPHVEHRFCTRHLYSNLRMTYPSTIVRGCFWNACTATHPQAFKPAMKELERASKGATERMNQLEPKLWCKAYFPTHSMADSTENNMSECFSSWILRAMYMPIIDMLTEIHDMIMTRLHQKRDAMVRNDCIIVPRIKKVLDEAVRESSGFTVLWDGRENYVVKGKGSSVCVNLKNRTCSCRVWDLTGVPCCSLQTASFFNGSRDENERQSSEMNPII